ncbi:MAG: fumarate hydratase [Promethearchaeota archaeon]
MSREKLLHTIEQAIYQLVISSSTSVTPDVLKALQNCVKKNEPQSVSTSQLNLMISNIDYGKKHQIPICQDTGHINFFLQLGEKFPIQSNFKELILKVLEQLTNESKIRPNTVDPISNENPNSNGGINTPPLYLEIVPDSSNLIITVLNKGGGSENMCRLFMLPPSKGQELIIPTIKKAIMEAGGKPCPPIILGIGLGGDSVKAMYLAKKALLRPLGSHHPRKEISQLETNILQEMNTLDVGVMGLGGPCTCLAVHMEYSMRHPATYPLGLVVECYSHRTRSCKINSKGELCLGKLDLHYKFIEETNNVQGEME